MRVLMRWEKCAETHDTAIFSEHGNPQGILQAYVDKKNDSAYLLLWYGVVFGVDKKGELFVKKGDHFNLAKLDLNKAKEKIDQDGSDLNTYDDLCNLAGTLDGLLGLLAEFGDASAVRGRLLDCNADGMSLLDTGSDLMMEAISGLMAE